MKGIVLKHQHDGVITYSNSERHGILIFEGYYLFPKTNHRFEYGIGMRKHLCLQRFTDMGDTGR